MKKVTFITGNANKARYLAKYLGVPVNHQKLDLDEIQSANLDDIVERKARQAYDIMQSPVLVEDVALGFTALAGLPGPFIKFFVDNAGLEACCRMLDGFDDRSATARSTFGYYDGEKIVFFRGSMNGTIRTTPYEGDGWDWDKIFIPEGYDTTRAELSEEDEEATHRIIKPFEHIADFLKTEQK